MERLADIVVFARVAERRSFTLAGKELSMSTSTVSKHIARLESDLSIKLIERSTHSLKLTESGSVFYKHCVHILAALETAKADAAGLSADVKGVLRVHSTNGIAMNLVAPAAIEFAKLYELITIDLSIGAFPIEMTGRGFDIVVASRHFGQDDPELYQNLVSRNLGPMPYVVCASPGYIRIHGVPSHPSALERRSCLIHITQKRNPDEWFFADRSGRYSVVVNSAYRSNLESAVLLAAVEGLGIARLPEYTARTELKAGRLELIFDGSVQSGRAVKAFYSKSRHVPLKVREFVGLLHRRYKESLRSSHPA